MRIIPVIDVLNGSVVHAKKGERHHYQAIQSLLTHSSKPLDIVAALLEYYPFPQLYIADLNAIQKLGNTYDTNYSVIASIAQHFPKLKVWLDAGISNTTQYKFWKELNVTLIVGSENFTSVDNYLSLNLDQTTHSTPSANFVLSLDFMPNGYQGPSELLVNTKHWPKDVILMSLAHVGANQGTNIELLEQFKQEASHFNLYAAGGVRNFDDLTALKQIGIHGALIATALHQKQLSYAQLETLLK